MADVGLSASVAPAGTALSAASVITGGVAWNQWTETRAWRLGVEPLDDKGV